MTRRLLTIRSVLAVALFLGIFGAAGLFTNNKAYADPKCSRTASSVCTESQCKALGANWIAPDSWDKNGTSKCVFPANSGNSGVNPVTGPCNKPTFFGLVPWYQYLDMQTGADGTCEVAHFDALGNGSNSGILLIVLAIIDDLLRIAGMVAVVFVIVAGFKIMTAQGEPEKVASGRKTLVFALVGLAIAVLAVAIVSFIGKSLGA